MLSDDLLVEVANFINNDPRSYDLRKKIADYLEEFAPEYLDALPKRRELDWRAVHELRRRIVKSTRNGTGTHHEMVGLHHGVSKEYYRELMEAVILEEGNTEKIRGFPTLVQDIRRIQSVIDHPDMLAVVEEACGGYWPVNWWRAFVQAQVIHTSKRLTGE